LPQIVTTYVTDRIIRSFDFEITLEISRLDYFLVVRQMRITTFLSATILKQNQQLLT